MQTLNIMDQVMASMHDALRTRGYAGLLQHSYLLLRGRLDEGTLRHALARLARCYPVVTARLVPWKGQTPRYWEPVADRACPLTVAALGAPDPESLWHYAARLFDTPVDAGRTAPVQFHLLHFPDGRDALVVQWVHGLMDGKAGEFLLQEIDRLHAGSAVGECAPPAANPPAEHAVEPSVLGRLKNWLAYARALLPRGRTVQLVLPGRPGQRPSPTRVGIRCIDAGRTGAWLERVRRICGFSNPAPVLLASLFRVVARLAPVRPSSRSVLYTFLPVNLRPPGPEGPVFANSQTYLILQARAAALADRDELARSLHRQIRDQLRRGVDRGVLAAIRFLSTRPHQTARGMKRMGRALSFIFGYHGTTAALPTFCGTAVEHLYSGLPLAWSPPGLSFAAHQFNRCLNLLAATSADTVPEPRAKALLDAVEEDLLP